MSSCKILWSLLDVCYWHPFNIVFVECAKVYEHFLPFLFNWLSWDLIFLPSTCPADQKQTWEVLSGAHVPTEACVVDVSGDWRPWSLLCPLLPAGQFLKIAKFCLHILSLDWFFCNNTDLACCVWDPSFSWNGELDIGKGKQGQIREIRVTEKL